MLSFEAIRQYGASAVLLQAFDGEILACAPDHPSLSIDAGATGSHQDDVSASDLRKLANVGEILAAVAGTVQEYRDAASRGHFVDDVVDDAARQQIPLGAILACNPDRSIDEAKACGNGPQLGSGRDEGIERRIGPRNAERVR